MLNKKAISPVVAWVLLISLAVGLSAVYFVWIEDLIGGMQPGNLDLECDNIGISAKATSCNPLTILLKNNGRLTITPNLIINYADGTIADLDLTEDIPPLQTKTLNTGITKSFTRVNIIPKITVDEQIFNCNKKKAEVNISAC